jgi:hypothetical protein
MLWSMRSCTFAVVTLRATPRAENIASNTTYCTIHLTTLEDATFETGSTHTSTTAHPASRARAQLPATNSTAHMQHCLAPI